MITNKGFWIAWTLFVLGFLGDAVSTLRVGVVAPYLEANPLNGLIGITGIILLNIVYAGCMIYWYNKTTNPTTRFLIIILLVTTFVIRLGIIYTNWMIGSNPPTLQEALAVTSAMKAQVYIYYVKQSLIPYFIGLISYLLFQLDHHIGLKFEVSK